jgi:hypothetical protein
MEQPARSLRCYFGFTIRRKFSVSALNFTQVYASRAGRGLKPAKYAVRIETEEIEGG